MKPLENTAVQLIPMELDHIEDIHKAAQAEKIWEHMSINLTERNAVVHYVEDALRKRKNGTDFAYVIISRQSQEILGATWFLDISRQHRRLEIGSTWITPKYWRTKINTNCKYLLLQYCFDELKLNRVQIKTGHKNARSQKAIERIGAVKEGTLRNHMITKEGNLRHTVMYSIIREEWPQVRQRFEECLLT
jgi:RimJ/RimL family protein N-acetyltransferase